MYNIVIVADDGYIVHAAVMLTSLFETNKDKCFSVYLFTNGVSDKSVSRLECLCKAYKSIITIINPEEQLASSLSISLKELPVGQWTTMMYYKLFIPTVLPKSEERCLFLDVDMIINSDIEELYNWDLHDSVIAAVEDMPDCVKIKERIGLPQEAFYINSGVMVCDLNRWRQMETVRPIFDFVKHVSDKIINEQDVIALYFKGKLSLLPIKWNMVTFYFLRVPKIFDKYLPQLREALYNPNIIHFAAPIKPWYRDSQHPYANLYKKYLLFYCEALHFTSKEKVNLLRLPYGEKLSIRKRINKTIRNLLNKYNIFMDEGYTPHL